GFQLSDGILHAAAQIEHLFGIPGEDPAGGGERDAASESFEQFGPQLLFQLPDLGTDGRLSPVARLGGLRETFQPDDFQKRVKLIEIHKKSRMRAARLKTRVGKYCNNNNSARYSWRAWDCRAVYRLHPPPSPLYRRVVTLTRRTVLTAIST